MYKRSVALLVLTVIVSIVVTACAPAPAAPQVVEKVVTQQVVVTQVVPKEVVVTKQVEVEKARQAVWVDHNFTSALRRRAQAFARVAQQRVDLEFAHDSDM
jgi:hypothetical protein